MKKFRWQLLIIMITGLIVGVLLIIQQIGDGVDVEITPSPIAGGIYTEALVGNFMRLNPFLDIYNAPDRDVNRLIFNGLIHFDSRGIPQADLAESWGVSRDGTIYNFSLRPDVFWHDGEAFTSRDVLFTIDILKSQHHLIPQDLSNFWSDINVVVLSDSQVQFLLPEPFAPFLDYLSFGILPEHLLGNLGLEDMIDHPFNLAPIGTGPFRFQRLLVDNDVIVGVVLEAFDGYYLGRPYLDEVNFRYYQTSTEALTAYHQGEVEGFGLVDDAILQEVLKEQGLAIYTARESMLTMAYLNLDNPQVSFVQSPDFRRAMFTAINRALIVERAFDGQAVLANGPILSGTWAYYDSLERVIFDLVAARSLFESSGATFNEEANTFMTEDGLEIALTLLYPDTARFRQIAEFIAEDWKTLGIKVTLEAKPYEEVLSDLEARNYQTALVDINLTRSPDPDPYPFWGQAQIQSGQNYAEWDNRSASEFLEQARTTVDLAERERLYRNFQVLFMRELPSFPLFYPVYTYAITDDINDVNLGPIIEPADRFNNINEWYILAGKDISPTQTTEALDTSEE